MKRKLEKIWEAYLDELITIVQYIEKSRYIEQHIFKEDKLTKNKSKRKIASLNPEIFLLERGEVQLIKRTRFRGS
ncbi:hypothetical protein [Lysinibacillus cavernae]|uniref:hypothetical protein n=1 Tax=Lysinibacillus cavernae TaxID=2666135 RepID=UPI0018C2D22C|nr:hypothetical protein [Lysinibacillus cavernae]